MSAASLPILGDTATGERHFWRFWLGLVAGLLSALGVSLSLSFDPYIAWQQAQATQLFHSRWVYERLHFDASPIEVAIIGSSKLESGISPEELSKTLSQRMGRPVPVANLSIVMPGRDFADRIVTELLATHPEVRLILLSDDGEITNSHPMFKETAPLRDVASAPLLVNLHYAANLLAMPYRNFANAAQQQKPAWFGVTSHFEAGGYLGTDLDRTLGYQTPEGRTVNGDISMDATALGAMSKAAVARQAAGLAWLRFLPADQRLAIDHYYLASIAWHARAAHVRLAVVALPLFGPVQPAGDHRAYNGVGPVISVGWLSSRPELYQSAAHLNRTGAKLASIALGDAIVPLLSAGRLSPPEDQWKASGK